MPLTKVLLSRWLLLVVAVAPMSACSSSPATSLSTGPGSPRSSIPSTPLSELAIPGSFKDACGLESSVCANSGDFGPYGPLPAEFRRPLALPSVEPGQACPASAGGELHTLAFGGYALGTGPARPIVPLEAGRDPAHGIPLTSLPRSGWYGFKTLWFTDPSYHGPVLIRGARIDAPGLIAFGESPELGELIIPPGPTLNEGRDGYREAPGGTYVKTPGCYAWQVDGQGFSSLIVFLAAPAPPAPTP